MKHPSEYTTTTDIRIIISGHVPLTLFISYSQACYYFIEVGERKALSNDMSRSPFALPLQISLLQLEVSLCPNSIKLTQQISIELSRKY